MEKVTIIVPIFNLDNKILECIKSLINQSYKNTEIILVNDGSKDKSLEICRKYEKKDSRIMVVDIPNGGVEHARYVGLQKASGNYVMFVDGDDYLPSNAVEILLNKAIKTNADIVTGNMTRVIGKRGIIKNKTSIPIDKEILNQPELFNKYYISFFGVNIIPVNMCAKLYRMELFSNEIPPLTGLKHGEDLSFNMHLFPNVTKLAFVSENVYFYRYGGMTTKMNYDLFNTACKTYEIKKKYLNKFEYNKGNIYIAIELKNFFNTYIESYFKYTNYSQDEIVERISKEVNENKVFSDALIEIQKSKYCKSEIEKLLKKDFNGYIQDVFLNINKIKLKYKLKKFIIKIVGSIF